MYKNKYVHLQKKNKPKRMNNELLYKLMLLIMFLVCWSCHNQIEVPIDIMPPETKPPVELPQEFDPPNLKGTQWKLNGIVDVETNILKVLEPKECETCYTFTFDTDTTAFGKSVFNEFYINGLNPIVLYGTNWGEPEDAGLYKNIIRRSVTSYDANENELKFFFDNNRKYLYFTPGSYNTNLPDELCTVENLWEQPLHVIKECIHGKWKVLKTSFWGSPGNYYPTNNIVNIDTLNNTVLITTEENDPWSRMNANGTFSFNWEYKEVYGLEMMSNKPQYSTYVMQNNDNEIEGWFFDNIAKDILYVVVDFKPYQSQSMRYYFLKLKNNYFNQ